MNNSGPIQERPRNGFLFLRKAGLRIALFIFIVIAFLGSFASNSWAQGQVHFNNRVPPDINARFLCPDGTGLGPGITAQLFGGPAGTPSYQLSPLFPTTTFRSGAAAGYVVPVDVTVPNVPPGSQATLVMRAFFGPTYEQSTFFLSSNPITITLGGGILPPANLVGLQASAIIGPPGCIPEPGTNLLIAAGALVLTLRVRRFPE